MAVLILMTLAGGAGAQESQAPLVRVLPNPLHGSLVATAYGQGWCAERGCSPVTLRIADRVVDKAIRVAPDGTFEHTFAVEMPVGYHHVEARQKAAGGKRLTAVDTVLVSASDFGPGPRPKGDAPPPAPPTNESRPESDAEDGGEATGRASPTDVAATVPTSAGATSPPSSLAAADEAASSRGLVPWALAAVIVVALLAAGILVRRRRES